MLEDDAALSSSFAFVLASIEHLELNFDMIDLHRSKTARYFVQCTKIDTNHRIGRLGLRNVQTTSYVTYREGVKKFLDVALPILFPDIALHRYWKNGLNIYGLGVLIVKEDDQGRSYVDETRKDLIPHLRVQYTDVRRFDW